MKKLSILFFSLVAFALFMQSCDDYKSYAEQLKEERNLIKRFISQHEIETISLDQFEAQDSLTIGNQYVEFNNDGVYLQVVHEAEGPDARFAETNDVILVRCLEVYLATNDTVVNSLNVSSAMDEFRYTKSSTQVLGQFIKEKNPGMMQYAYGSAVPAGWLIPLSYLKLSTSNGADRTKVKLIVSAKSGQADAIQNIYPCYYELTYQLY